MPFCSVLLCRQGVSSLVPVQKHIPSFAILTNVQSPNTSAVQRFSGQNAYLVALCCCAKSWQQPCATAKPPIKTCYQHRCFEHQTPVQCGAFQGKRHALLLCAAVQRLWQESCAPAKIPIKTCYPHRCFDHQTPLQCITLQGKLHALLLCAAVQTSWQQPCSTATTPVKICYPHR